MGTPQQPDIEELGRLIDADEIDTVVVAFPDLQGRLMGKRVTGRFFRGHVLEHGIDACSYLLAVDVDMTPLPDYRFASWETGYGDVVCRPDLATLRLLPWLEKTALVLCDLFDETTGEPVDVAPRQILRRQIARAQEAGYTIKCGSELEFILFRDTYEEAAAKGYAGLTPHSSYIEDYHVLQTTRDEYLIRAIRNGVDNAGIRVEFSKGEAGLGQHEINLMYAEALEMADRHAIYKNAAKEIAGLNGRSLTFMAKYDMDAPGSSCHIHSSVWDATGDTALMHDPAALDHMSDVFRGWLGGSLALSGELAWLYAPTVNSYKRYQPESWAPTAIAWGRDNRTCGFRVVGDSATSHRMENRIPGADCNPYLAFAATIAAGLYGIEHGIEPPERFDGNAYEAHEVPRVPHSIVDAIAELEHSEAAVAAFGPDVHEHLVNTAQQEWLAFGGVVTDWERRRCFEQF
ncbi:MAG: glutamine synthetase family protein [Acidimicrobiia bacterium]